MIIMLLTLTALGGKMDRQELDEYEKVLEIDCATKLMFARSLSDTTVIDLVAGMNHGPQIDEALFVFAYSGKISIEDRNAINTYLAKYGEDFIPDWWQNRLLSLIIGGDICIEDEYSKWRDQ